VIEYRHVEPKDYGPIIGVLNEWWGGRQMADMLPKLFFVHFRDTSFVAHEGGAIRGFLIGFRSQTHPEQAYVHFIGVDPGTRGAGIGKALYERFFEAVRALGCREVHCVTSPVNAGSIAFHTSIGFEAIETAIDYDGPGEDRVRFRRAI
jgi:ribosomal protein S18 acetylase RimI-like enzyme